MRNVLNHRVTRFVARVLVFVCLLLWHTPPAAAFYRRPEPKGKKYQALPPEIRAAVERREREAAKHRPDVQELSGKEMDALRGAGPYRNRGFSGVLPWQRSLRDVNLCNGNLFKSFTDIQVSPARGAGLAFQRTYNSSDDRVGAFGIGWTHAYDIRIEEAGNNVVPRTDFFGGKHNYTRDADGLYSPPPYLFDELSSEYDNFLADGPAKPLADERRGMDGTVKHFFINGSERSCDYIEDRHGNRTLLTYGLQVTLGDGSTKRLLTAVTDPSLRHLEISWTNLNPGVPSNPAWRITQVRGPFDPVSGNPIYTVAYEYNPDFNLWKVRQDPTGLNRITTYGYTSYAGMSGTENGLLQSISDPLSQTISYAYSLAGLTNTLWVTGVTEPSTAGSHIWTIGAPYFSGGLFKVDVSSTAGVSFSLSFDSQLRKRMYFLAVGMALWQTEYDTANNVTRTIRMSTIAGPGMYAETIPVVEQVMTYGPHGNVLTQRFTGHPGVTTHAYYNASKYFQKESVTDANGNVSRMDYFDNADPNIGNRGELKWVRDARYGITGKQFGYTYNQYGQKTSETNLRDVLTTFSFGDQWGNLTQVVQDPGGLNRTNSVVYDVAGRILSSTDPKGQQSSFQYNGVGQPLVATLPGETITYGYGLNGRTESVQDGRGLTTIAYEAGNDRVQSVTDPVTGLVAYTYGPAGNRLTMSLPGGGQWVYAYSGMRVLPKDEPDSAGLRLQTITDDQGRIVNYYFDDYGTLHQARNNWSFDGGGAAASYVDTRYRFNEIGFTHGRGLLREIKHTWNWNDPMEGWQSRVLVQNNYVNNTLGLRTSNQISDQNGPVRTELYGYDELQRLTSTDYGDGEIQGYTFDPMGNRLTKTVNGTPESYGYNNANMLLTRGAHAYVNDNNGNTLTGAGRVNTWDGQNRLTQCVYGGNTSSFVYGSDGLRRRATVQGVITDYTLDGQSVVREAVQGGATKTYLHGVRGPEYERVGGGAPLWNLFDGLGSVLGTVDASGNLVSTRKYDVFGAVRGSTGPSGSKHKYVGNLGHPSEDETGLIYMRARSLDPVTGRFLSQDPDRSGLNWFVYANQNPISAVDADGRNAVDLALIHLLIGLIVFAQLLIVRGAWRALFGYTTFMIGQAIAEAAPLTLDVPILWFVMAIYKEYGWALIQTGAGSILHGVALMAAGWALKMAAVYLILDIAESTDAKTDFI